jgi:hypothetical protein
MFKVTFTKNTDVKFADPRTGKVQWYGSDYGKGTSMEFIDFLSGNEREIRVLLVDGEVGILDPQAVSLT